MISNKARAAVDTVGAVVAMIAVVVGMNLLIENVSKTTMINAIMIGLFGFMVYMLYGIRLGQIEYKETLNKMVDKK